MTQSPASTGTLGAQMGPGETYPGSETQRGCWQEREQVATLAQIAGCPSEAQHRDGVASLPC